MPLPGLLLPLRPSPSAIPIPSRGGSPGGPEGQYANDYGDISLLKDFTDRHALAVVVVHHIRKQGDSDVFNRVSGTTGLTGSADATFVLEKEHRASDTAVDRKSVV